MNVSQSYFLDHETIIFQETSTDGRFNLVRYHIPTDTKTVILRDAVHRTGGGAGYRGIQYTGGFGKHALVFQTDGSVDLMDLHTCSILHMICLDSKKLITSESPDGTKIMLAYQEAHETGFSFSRLGLLNPKTGVVQMLVREISTSSETFWGWLDSRTLVLTTHDSNGGYYIYVYEFQE